MWRTSHGHGQSIRIDYQNRGAADSRHRSALPDSYIQQLQQLQQGDTVCDIWASVLTMMHILSVWRLGLGRSGNCWAHTIRAVPHYWNPFLMYNIQFFKALFTIFGQCEQFTQCVQNSFKLGIRSTYYSLQML